jgi:hypothetical protein
VLVRTIRPATEAEVLESFWTAELAASSRWTSVDVDERKRQWLERDGLFGNSRRDQSRTDRHQHWERSKLVLLEGHGRLTAYAAFPEHLPDELEVYLGVSPRIGEWCQW